MEYFENNKIEIKNISAGTYFSLFFDSFFKKKIKK
jgi:hypothetical protein